MHNSTWCVEIFLQVLKCCVLSSHIKIIVFLSNFNMAATKKFEVHLEIQQLDYKEIIFQNVAIFFKGKLYNSIFFMSLREWLIISMILSKTFSSIVKFQYGWPKKKWKLYFKR